MKKITCRNCFRIRNRAKWLGTNFYCTKLMIERKIKGYVRKWCPLKKKYERIR